MQLVLDTNGLMVKKRNNTFWIIAKTQKRQISPHRITSIAVTADCLMSSAAIKMAAKHQIPIFFFNRAAKVEARLWSTNFGSIATIRRQQVFFAIQPEATDWMVSLFRLKIIHQSDCLKFIGRTKSSLKSSINSTIEALERQALEFDGLQGKILQSCNQSMMGIEGNIAKKYWATLSAGLPLEFQFSVRSRRPAQDEFNAALNYLYGMLYSVISSAVLAAGLDPYLGFLHVDQYNKPTFVFDIIEPFRPWVDRLLVEQFLKHKIKSTYFEQKEGGYFLNKEGKRFLIPLFNDWLEKRKDFKGKRLSHKNQIYRFAGEFAQFLLTQKY